MSENTHILQSKANQYHNVKVWTYISQWPSESQWNTTEDGMQRNKEVALKQQGRVLQSSSFMRLTHPRRASMGRWPAATALRSFT